MKWALVLMILMTVGLIAIAGYKGDGSLQQGFKAAGTQGLKILPILVLAFLMMGFIDVLLPREVVQTWLTDASGWKGLAIAWLAGILTPGGSIIGMPLAAGLMKAGVSPSVLVTYLTSLALLSSIRFPLEVGFYGWRLMLIRVLASAILPFVAGLTTRWLLFWFNPNPPT
jgi:uncharacterized membrane protein YraQ (UPF0718 family)